MKQTDPHHIAIGTRSGIAPSSGYGFAFIQKQIQQLVASFPVAGRWYAKPLIGALISGWIGLKVLSDRQSDALLFYADGKRLIR